MPNMDHQHYNPDRFTRKSLRLSTRKYTEAGAYFVTIRALPPDPLFAIPKLRYILLDTWQTLPKRFPGVTLDEFVVMPDHIHFILWLDGTRDNAPTLGRVIGAYKSLTTVTWLNHIKARNMSWSGHVWQRNYYEHVVRNPSELEEKRQYIRNNPIRLQLK